ncbi:uncharacterized protein METZ01_LOCUS299742, partial [marine metagenome]
EAMPMVDLGCTARPHRLSEVRCLKRCRRGLKP